MLGNEEYTCVCVKANEILLEMKRMFVLREKRKKK